MRNHFPKGGVEVAIVGKVGKGNLNFSLQDVGPSRTRGEPRVDRDGHVVDFAIPLGGKLDALVKDGPRCRDDFFPLLHG